MKNIICNGKIIDHINLYALLKNTDALESKLLENPQRKLNLILLGIRTLDICANKYESMYCNPVIYYQLFRCRRQSKIST